MSEDFLSRWSRRKRAAQAEALPPLPADAMPSAEVAAVVPDETQAEVAPAAALPPVESLTPESDFIPFMRADVDAGVRREALRTLFQDPRFNVMDGLDVYIDDYSKPDPLPAGWLEKMTQVEHLGHYKPPVEEAPAPIEPPAETAPPPLEAAPEAPPVAEVEENGAMPLPPNE